MNLLTYYLFVIQKTVLVDAGGNGNEQWALNALKKVFDGGLRKTGLVLFGKRGTGATRRVLHNTHFFCVFKSESSNYFIMNMINEFS